MGSFGNEIKDFISAFSAGKKMFSNTDEEYARLKMKVLQGQLDEQNDPEAKKLKRDAAKALIKSRLRGPKATDPEITEGRRLDNEYKRKRNEAIGKPPPGAADELPTLGTPPSGAPGKTSALDLDEELPEDVASYEDEDLEEDLPVQYAARGGLIKRPVRHYALGGEVEEDELEDEPLPEEAPEQEADPVVEEAVPSTAAAPAAPDTQDRLSSDQFSRQAGHDAVLEGLKYAQARASGSRSDAGGGAVPTGASSRNAGGEAYLRGAGAASSSEMNEVRKKIDPENKMAESERNLAALSQVYEYNLRQNNPEGAKRAAASMVQYFRQVSDRYKALSVAAAENGDVDGTIKAIMKAHANIPDGQDMKLKKNADGSVAYTFVDTQSGKTIEKGVATPEQILQFATRGASMSFDDLIVRAGGQRTAPAKPEGPRKVEDRSKAMEVVDEGMKGIELDPDRAPALRHAASQIVSSNDVDGRTAFQIVDTIVDPASAGKVKIKMIDGGGAVAALPDGREVKLSRDALQNLGAMRALAATKAQTVKAEGEKKQKLTDEKARLKTQSKDATDFYYAGRRQQLKDNRMTLDRQGAIPE